MPFFSRSDGTLVPGLPAMRRVMPYIMRGRNESAVYLETRCDVTSAKKWLWAYNRASEETQCTFLHLFLYNCRQVMQEFPQLDRFVSGRRIYQRRVSTASLTMKASMEKDAPSYSIKLPFAEPEECLADYSRRIDEILRNAKQFHERAERETELLLKLPDFLVRALLAVRDWLDSVNLLPAMLRDDDPLYTSLFVSNGGSLGLPEAFHHLFEHGNCSAFAMIASLQKCPVADWDDNVTIRDILPIRWTVDDRIADGFICAEALKRFQSLLEDPARYYGPPEEAARQATNRSGKNTSAQSPLTNHP